MANPMPLAMLALFGFQALQGYFNKGGTGDLKVFDAIFF